MRKFNDERGRTWEVVVGRESWGTFVALFIPDASDAEVRQASLGARGRREADEEVEALSEGELRTLLERAEPKHLG